MSFYLGLAATASKLIDKYGQTLMLVRETDSIDPVTGITTESATRNYQVNAILKNYPDNMVDGTRIKAGDRLIVIGGKLEPLLTDKFKLQNKNWNIESIKTSNPAGTVLSYFVQVRK